MPHLPDKDLKAHRAVCLTLHQTGMSRPGPALPAPD